MKDYKGYSAKISLDEEQDLFHGEVEGITDVVTFEGKSPEELTSAFHDSVDDYLAFCEELEEQPDKPYSGRFVLRLSPELHQRVAIAAKKADVSMNEWIVSLVEERLEGGAFPAAGLAQQKLLLERLASMDLSRLAAFLYRPTLAYESMLPILLGEMARPHAGAELWERAREALAESAKIPKPSSRPVR